MLYNFLPFNQTLCLQIVWFDKVLHGLGGILIAHLFLRLLNGFCAAWWKKIPAIYRVLLVVALVVLVGYLWEGYEFLSDYYRGTHYQLSNTDTMGDLFMDLAGGLFASLLSLLRLKK